MHSSIPAALLWLALCVVADAEAPQCMEVREDGTCAASASTTTGSLEGYTETCGLYMAESSIPNAGWGMYTNRDIAQGEPILPLDVVIQAYDIPDYLDQTGGRRQWLLAQYVWNADMIRAQFDADLVHSVVPGIGMLANSHPGLVNCHNEGANYRRPWTNRTHPATGAFTHYHNLTFSATVPIQKGEEIFDEYSDDWFRGREKVFGKIPLSDDFQMATELLHKFAQVLPKAEASSSSPYWENPVMAEDVWTLLLETIVDHADDQQEYKRLLAALPESSHQAADWLTQYPEGDRTTARASVPNFIRSTEWLEAHGMCLDNIAGRDTEDSFKGKGAFATRFLPKGTLVAPAPVIHLNREDLHMYWDETYDVTKPQVERTVWKGDQLLLNYCYGNPLTSLLFFPYAPAVNLINHANTNKGETANVALRWSKNHSNAEMMEWSTKKVLKQNMKAGLMMEIYALRDIAPGEEILLDYGEDWQHSWEIHERTFIRPEHSEDYKVAWDYDNADELPVEGDPDYPPPYVESRCWPGFDEDEQDEEGFFLYQDVEDSHPDFTVPCTVIGKEETENGIFYMTSFYHEEEDEDIKVKGVPYDAILYFDQAYTGNQHLRQGFRHYIELPDDMIPPNWRDMGIGVEDNSECGLYFAESAIPHSGMGMYTARDVGENERIGFGDVSVQVEDILEQARLRLFHEGFKDVEEKEWLLEHYFWTAESTMAQFDAAFIESMVPGFGMLANSHTGLHNSAMRLPYQPPDLHRGMDPGSGASTTYHDVHYVAEKRLVAGEEIFVEYGDNYFYGRKDLYFVPLSNDFKKADGIVKQFAKLVKQNLTSEFAVDLFSVMSSIYLESDQRLANALPCTLDGFEKALQEGSAEVSVPDKVRSLEWLKENGVCIDNIMPMKSRIIQAGRGAFATRRIKKGDIISPVPVVQVRRDHLDVYDADDWESPGDTWLEGKQIILNYCFGHPESSVMLFPYAPVVNYVNHHSTKVNAEMRWSLHASHDAEMLKMEPRELTDLERTGLVMDMVATRDIEVGEEIYLHYGQEWEEKWVEHVKQWEPHPDEYYVAASVLNKQVEWLRTPEELDNDPYPPNVFTGCFMPKSIYNVIDSGKGVEWRVTRGMLDDATDVEVCRVIARTTEADPLEIENEKDSYRPPHVTYTVEVEIDEEGPPLTVVGVPRIAIVFLDHSYANDQYNREAFRHEIVLPDEMIPEVWRDLKK